MLRAGFLPLPKQVVSPLPLPAAAGAAEAKRSEASHRRRQVTKPPREKPVTWMRAASARNTEAKLRVMAMSRASSRVDHVDPASPPPKAGPVGAITMYLDSRPS